MLSQTKTVIQLYCLMKICESLAMFMTFDFRSWVTFDLDKFLKTSTKDF